MAEQANNCCVIEHLIRIDAGVSGIGANMKSVHQPPVHVLLKNTEQWKVYVHHIMRTIAPSTKWNQNDDKKTSTLTHRSGPAKKIIWGDNENEKKKKMMHTNI